MFIYLAFLYANPFDPFFAHPWEIRRLEGVFSLRNPVIEAGWTLVDKSAVF